MATRKKATPKNGLTWGLSTMVEHFEAQGWLLDQLSSTMLEMSQDPSEHIHHRLLLLESPKFFGSPPAGLVALNCLVTIEFKDLEKLIAHCLGEEEARSGSYFPSLVLAVPPEQRYMGHYCVIDTDPDSDGAATREFLRQYDDYLAPVYMRMRSYDMFADDQHFPPEPDCWHWAIRRLAYTRLHGDAEEWQRLSRALRPQAAALLEAHANGDAEDSRRFTSIDALKLTSSLRDARKALTVIDVLNRDAH